jgi:hypothetical protein
MSLPGKTALVGAVTFALLAGVLVFLLDHSSSAPANAARKEFEGCMAVVPGGGGPKLAVREKECERREAVINRLTPAEQLRNVNDL